MIGKGRKPGKKLGNIRIYSMAKLKRVILPPKIPVSSRLQKDRKHNQTGNRDITGKAE